jgi:transcriptional regulator with XRE-family HTH domain
MIVQKVRAIRYKRFLTQAELAKASGMSIPVIQRMENGESVLFSSIKAVAGALGVSPAELIPEDMPDDPETYYNERAERMP